MNKPYNNKAWLGVLPVLLIVAFSGVIPLMTVVNYSVQDILDFNSRFFVGFQWYTDTLQDPRFIDAFLRQLGFSASVLLLEIPLGLMLARGMPRQGLAASLLLVVGTAALMEFVGLSMALGAFIAGVLFADSHHRHAVIADIEPFKGLLMGLFFIAVGMTVDLALLVERPGLVATLALGLVVGKAIILIFFGWLSRLPRRAILRFTASLAQGGEFAFVIFSAALGFNVLARETVDLMILVVAISMMLTPLLFRAAETFDRARPPDTAAAPEAPDRFTETDSPVIIAGFGRMGQIVARALRLSDTRFTALDNDLEQISFVSRFGDKAFFGDATRPHILRAAGADTAKVFVICVHDVAVSIQIAETVRSQYPDLFVIARVRNRHHAYRMLELGVHKVVRETFAGSLDIAESALVETGQSPSRAGAMVSRFKDHDEELLREQFAIRDNEAALIASSEAAAQEFRRLMDQDGKRENE